MAPHLDTLQLRLSNERARLNSAKSRQEKEIRKVFVNQCEKEIAKELKSLGIEDYATMSDDELMKELMD